MYERLTDRARKVLVLSNAAAQQFGDEYIDSQHILFGLIKEGVGVAAVVLKNFDVDLVRVAMEIEKIVHSKPDRPPVSETLPNAPRAKQILEYAIEECRLLKHNYVGTEHLLLGLLREDKGVAAQVFQNLSLDRQTIRNEVLNILGHNLDTSASISDTTNPTELSEPTRLVLQMLPLIPPHERQIVMKKLRELE